MKKKSYRLLSFILILLFLSCSDDDNSNTENGINHAPNLKATGKSAHGFLSADNYKSIDIEVLYVGSFQPNAQTLVNLKQFMENRLNKPGGITISQREITSPGGSPYDINKVADIETENRTKYNDGDILTMYILFIDGNYTTDTSTTFTLGAAYRNTSCVIFEKAVQQLSNSVNEPNRVDLETTVILHELGHLLGLVNLGSSMQTQHLDQAHDRHCDNPDCLMYWEAESNHGMQGMLSGNVAQLDAHCLADLKANGGK